MHFDVVAYPPIPSPAPPPLLFHRYYSYTPVEVMSPDAFAGFEQAGVSDKEAASRVGKRFKDTVDGPFKVFRNFTERGPTPEACLKLSGLAAAVAPAPEPEVAGASITTLTALASIGGGAWGRQLCNTRTLTDEMDVVRCRWGSGLSGIDSLMEGIEAGER